MSAEKVKITDIQVSLGLLFKVIFGIGSALMGLGIVLLFISRLLFVDKSEFNSHKEENMRDKAKINARVAKVENLDDIVERVLLYTDNVKKKPSRPDPEKEN